MQLIDLLSPERVSVDAVARSKKRSLELASELLAANQPELTARGVFACLCARERLGSTGFGNGVALPHGRQDTGDTVSAAFLRLREPVDFDAADHQRVDLIFALIVPSHCEERHLELLSQMAEILSSDQRRSALRAAAGPQEVLQLLSQWQGQQVSG